MSEIKRIGGSTNAVVVKLPERQHCGVVVQADSMQNLLSLTQDAKDRLSANDWDELRDVIAEIHDLLSAYTKALEISG